jgi:DNA-binding CsgD family transcriptional regulator
MQYLAPGFTANRDAAARVVSQARNVLGDDCFTQAWDEGQGLTLDDAVAYAARWGGGRKRPAAGWAGLTPAELEVVRLVSEGLRNDAIARRLFIAPGTVKVHLSHIFAKLGITTRTELAAQAAAQDLTARSDGLPRSLPRRDTRSQPGGSADALIDNLYATAQAAGIAIKSPRVGDRDQRRPTASAHVA